MQYWYLATPYSSKLKGEKAKKHEELKRYEQAVQIVHDLSVLRMAVFSPIVHYHPVALLGNLPGDNEYWKGINENYIRNSQGIIVAQMKGWEESSGIKFEIQLAKSLKLPILSYNLTI